MPTPIVETHALAKTFRATPVLIDVDLKLFRGHGAVIVGGNGSGKTTLLSLLAGLLMPTSGHAIVVGEDTRRFTARYRQRIGMLSHQSLLYPNLTARENLEFYARLYAVPNPVDTADLWLARVNLADNAKDRVRSFSRGMEQRLAIARAMIHEPALLLFDEPFASLDSEGSALVTSLLKSALMEGCSLVATAHTPFEIQDVDLTLYEIARGSVVPYHEKEEIRLGGRLRSLLAPKSR